MAYGTSCHDCLSRTNCESINDHIDVDTRSIFAKKKGEQFNEPHGDDVNGEDI